MAEAIPALEAALSALNTLKPADITIVKTMKSPPAGVKLVMAAVCVMRDIKPDKINDPSGAPQKVSLKQCVCTLNYSPLFCCTCTCRYLTIGDPQKSCSETWDS